MYDIEVADRQQIMRIDPVWVEEIVRGTLQAEHVLDAEIAIALFDDAAIHVVNREHLQHDYPTDVISFLYDGESTGAAPSALRGAGKILDGELIVSTETAARMAAEVGWSAEAELSLYLVHGLLHLCGYDDLDETERALMRQRERDVLKLWGLVPHEHH